MSPAARLTFADFAEANRTRCVDSFHRLINEASVPAFVLGVAEEAGEVAGAVRALLGITKRKAGIEPADVGNEIADLVSYADLLAQALGMTLEEVLVAKFNKVSERVGSPIRLGEVRRG